MAPTRIATVPRHVGLLSTYSAREFGARGNGATNDTAALNRALAHVASHGGRLILPRGTYVVDAAPVVLTAMVTASQFAIEGDEAVIQPLGGSAGTVLKIAGALAASDDVRLLADAAAGARSITSNRASSVATGDIIQLTTQRYRNGLPPGTDYGYTAWVGGNYDELWCAGHWTYVKGEVLRVSSVQGTTIYLDTPLRDSYVGANTTIYKWNAPKVTVSGVRVEADANEGTGFWISYARDVDLRNIGASGCRCQGLLLQYILGGTVADSEFDDCYYHEVDGYGIYVTGCCEGIRIVRNVLHGAKHGVCVAGQGEPCRAVLIAQNHVAEHYSGAEPAIYSHLNGEDILVKDNYVLGAIALFGKNLSAVGNIVLSDYSAGGIHLGPTRADCQFMRSAGNTIICRRADPTGTDGLRLQPNATNLDLAIFSSVGDVILGFETGVAVRMMSAMAGITVRHCQIHPQLIQATKNCFAQQGYSASYKLQLDYLEIHGGRFKTDDQWLYRSTATDRVQKTRHSISDVVWEITSLTKSGLGGYTEETGDFFISNAEWIAPAAGNSSRPVINDNTSYHCLANLTIRNFGTDGGLYLRSAGYSIENLRTENCTGTLNLGGTKRWRNAQQSTTGETVGFTGGGGTTVTDASTFTGNSGSTAYRISDVVKHLKALGILAP